MTRIPLKTDGVDILHDTEINAIINKIQTTNATNVDWEMAFPRVFNVKNYGATGNGSTDDTTAIQTAMDAAGVLGGSVYIPIGTYTLSSAITSGLDGFQRAGLQIPSGVRVFGENRFKTKFTTTSVPGGAANSYFVCLTNKNRTTTATHIIIENIGFSLPLPTETATGLQAWDGAIEFYGVSRSIIRNCWINNGSINLRPNTTNQNTANALTLGSNTYNIIDSCMFENITGIGFYQASNSQITNCQIKKVWDDAIGIHSAGVRNRITANFIDGGPVVSSKGATTAIILINNDNAVGTGAASGAMKGNTVAFNSIMNNLGFFASGSGIDLNGASDTIIHGNIIHDCALDGIRVNQSNNTTMSGNIIFRNRANGAQVIAGTSGTFHSASILDNLIYNNGTAAANNHGIGIVANDAGRNLQNIIAMNNIVYDNQGTQTQLYVVRYAHDGNISNITISNNNVLGSPNFKLDSGGAGTLSGEKYFRNHGYVTENGGDSSVSNGTTISHGLATTPTKVVLTSQSSLARILSVTAKGATTFTVGVLSTTGTTVSNTRAYWYAEV